MQKRTLTKRINTFVWLPGNNKNRKRKSEAKPNIFHWSVQTIIGFTRDFKHKIQLTQLRFSYWFNSNLILIWFLFYSFFFYLCFTGNQQTKHKKFTSHDKWIKNKRNNTYKNWNEIGWQIFWKWKYDWELKRVEAYEHWDLEHKKLGNLFV